MMLEYVGGTYLINQIYTIGNMKCATLNRGLYQS